MATDELSAANAVLFVAHPGHELSLHGWLERTRPCVFVLTDGSGSGGVSRLASTARILDRCGAARGSIFGRFRDGDLYRAMLVQDAGTVLPVVHELADALSAKDAYLVADPWEFYNPSHDVCRVIADLATSLAAGRRGCAIESFDYLLTAQSRTATPAVTIELDDEALTRKLQAADGYTELRAEVETAIARYGRDSFRREHLYAIDGIGRLEAPDRTPFYETVGEGRVAAGSYATVLRYEHHFLPFVTALARAAGIPNALTADRIDSIA
jgi:AcrR family transcriptional regulator